MLSYGTTCWRRILKTVLMARPAGEEFWKLATVSVHPNRKMPCEIRIND
jgi:hypothetical protein